MAFFQPRLAENTEMPTPARARGAEIARLLLGAPARCLAMIHHLGGIRRQRRALLRLDSRLLDDIGISRDTAEAEARRPAWDAPRHWRS
ncbi:MAG: DUF1127 domain-containing protein [Pararhodobacter sp.]